MNGEISVEFCVICDEKTKHEKGNYRSQLIRGEPFHLDVSITDSIKKLSDGFRDFVLEERDGIVDRGAPVAYINNQEPDVTYNKLFAKRIRSLKCVKCCHLVKLNRFP
jgi:hypothetical protein